MPSTTTTTTTDAALSAENQRLTAEVARLQGVQAALHADASERMAELATARDTMALALAREEAAKAQAAAAEEATAKVERTLARIKADFPQVTAKGAAAANSSTTTTAGAGAGAGAGAAPAAAAGAPAGRMDRRARKRARLAAAAAAAGTTSGAGSGSATAGTVTATGAAAGSVKVEGGAGAAVGANPVTAASSVSASGAGAPGTLLASAAHTNGGGPSAEASAAAAAASAERLEQLQDEVERLQSDLNEATALAQHRGQLLQTLQASKVELVGHLETLRKAVAPPASDGSTETPQAQVRRLEEQLATERAERAAAEARASTAVAQRGALQAQVHEASKRIVERVTSADTSATRQRDEALGQAAQLRQRVAKLEADLAVATDAAERGRRHGALLEEQKQLLKGLLDQNERLKAANAAQPPPREAEQLIESLRVRVEKLAGHLEDKDRAIEGMKAAARAVRRTERNAELLEAAGRGDGAAAAARIAELTKEAASMDKVLLDTRAASLSQRKECEKARASIAALKAEVGVLRKQVKGLLAEVAAISNEFEKAQAQGARLLQSAKEKDDRYGQSMTDAAKVRQQQAAQKRELSALRNALHEAQERHRTSDELLRAKEKQIQAMRAQVDTANDLVVAAQEAAERHHAIAEAAQSQLR